MANDSVPANKQLVKDAIHEVLNERLRIDEAKHRKHHAFIELLQSREQRKQERYESIKRQVIGWSVITGIGLLGYAAWEWVIQSLLKRLS